MFHKVSLSAFTVGSKLWKSLPPVFKKPLGRMKASFEARPTIRIMKRKMLLELGRLTEFNKTDLIHLISKRLKLRNYLELCRTMSGTRYAEIDRTRFHTARRLMYNCPVSFDDGLPIDYKIADLDIEAAITELKLSADKVDICLVDGFHTYDGTTRDLICAYDSLADGGVLVVHDCSPMTEALASPTFVPGEWCGACYRSYLDFVLTRDDLDYCTVDVDYGCGIIFKNRTVDVVGPVEPELVAGWFDIHNDDKLAFGFFSRNRAKLLRLVSGKNFVRRFSTSTVRSIKESTAKSSSYHHLV